ncbi:cytochrome b/b6 domain-containing protein [Hymenobacter sp. BT683]|uniref:Cytochrome b/b6 domain-containing protein n=1 Tax=Hymenobacter jeongseonensis TaxID=2791027 RepID=A0ABS0IGR7_9BACT|nr:cytochrome b/b6 domain-containing protein [Hymenobacter jeongseonensis]MBF9236990.1 cytochrome b/b6 domain-containing protein [Hymenobacter jeongseonensis]
MMPAIAPSTEAPTKDYRAPLRVWHWGNALLVSLQLITILFQKVIVNARSAGPEFQETMAKENITLSVQQARSLTHILSERIWEWHIYFGWALVALFGLRVVLELRGPSELRFSARLLEVARRYRLTPAAGKSEAGKVLFAKSTYALFYSFLTIMVITGLILIYGNDVAFLRSIKHLAEETHNVTMYLIIAFFVVHVVGVVWAETTKDHGLISRMVGGEAPKS